MPERRGAPPATLAAAMTRNASRQSYLTIRWLADRAYRADAFALYAWFRWLDDTVDERLVDQDQRLAFVARQRHLLAGAAGGGTGADLAPDLSPDLAPDLSTDLSPDLSPDLAADLSPEEALLVGLVRPDRKSSGGRIRPKASDGRTDGLLLSLRSMLDVVEFDARRRGRPVTQQELDGYTGDLAVAVTEALHHCIGHGQRSPHDETRYAAVTGAHVAHMLRDLVEDLAAGYLNVPAELLADGNISLRDSHAPDVHAPDLHAPDVHAPDSHAPDVHAPDLHAPDLHAPDLHTPELRAWVRDRVELARSCFATGRRYLAGVENARCRLAGHAYIARFEWVLDAVERDGYRLRPGYPERGTLRGGLTIAADGARSALAAAGTRVRPAARRAPRNTAR